MALTLVFPLEILGKTKIKADDGLHHFTHGAAIGILVGNEHEKITILLHLVLVIVLEGNDQS